MELVLGEKQKEIVCPVCGHAVPALDSKTMDNLGKEQGKRRTLGIVAFVLFLLAAGLFIFFVKNSMAPGAITSSAKAMLGASVVSLLASMGVAFVASNRSYVCEF
jgi:hypothetical protein